MCQSWRLTIGSMCNSMGFYDFGRFYNLAPGEFNQTVDSVGIGARSNLLVSSHDEFRKFLLAALTGC